MSEADLLRHLPSIDRAKSHAALQGLDVPDELRTQLCRDAVAEVRARVAQGELTQPQAIDAALAQILARDRQLVQGPILRRILNGTGVLLHTGAGRAPLPAPALQAMTQTARGYCNLEVSLATGKRGSRQEVVRPLLRWLTGAQDALVVNNGAAAVLLALNGVARGRSVLVSRGELVEIGGGFRIPEVLTSAGARLCEVGTTNRTHLRDYAEVLAQPRRGQQAIAAVLHVHRSNFAIVGFTAQPELAELAALAHRHDLPLVCDLGSGALHAGVRGEPTVAQVLEAGADLVTFSGDKLIGGPQAGVVVGKAPWVAKLAGRPLARALRVDSLVLAGLEQVLRLHLTGHADRDLPVAAALSQPEAEVALRAQQLATALRGHLDQAWHIAVEPSEAHLGGGTDPLVAVPSHCVTLSHAALSGTALQAGLREAEIPVLGRVRGAWLWLDLRTLQAGSHGQSAEQIAAELAPSLHDALLRTPRST